MSSSSSPANLPKQALSHSQECPISEDIAEHLLEKILQSAAFRDAEILKRFLRYTVEHTLHGEGGQLKEYRVGIEVFNRQSSFDPRLDPVVRMAARRLRKKLQEYYDGGGRNDPIRIDIPKGSYAATFSLAHSSGLTPAPVASRVDNAVHRPVNGSDELPFDLRHASSRSPTGISSYRLWAGAGILTAIIALLAWGLGIFTPSPHASSVPGDAGRLVIADVTNTTHEPVFDDTLKQAIAVELSQSPLFDILSEARIRATLKLMSKPVDTKITADVAREICQRSGSRTYISGSILSLGSEYVIELNAVNCQTGDALAQEQATAEDKEHVLKAVEDASTRLRQRLGESLNTIQKFDIPLEQATTPSLDALKAYSLGNMARDRKGDAAALPFFNRAIELDPDFALAYDALGVSYSNLDEPGRASESISKAYEKRDRASDRERFQIGADYSQIVTGELDKANQICELWAQAYPRDEYPHDLLGVNYEFLGNYDKAITELSQAIRLNPDGAVLRSNLMEAQTALNRLEDAKTTYRLALARNLDHPYLHADMYGIAFLEGDTAEMGRQVSWAAGQPGGEDLLLSLESDSAAFSGRLQKARDYSRRAVESAERTGQKETAALWRMNSALREAEFGNFARARQETAAALKLASTRDIRILAALTLARAGDAGTAQEMADDLAARFPLNLVVNRYWLPTIRAAIDMGQGNAAKAVDILTSATSYELGYPNPQIEVGRLLYPVYVRGEAFLLLNQGTAAVAEFRKMVDNRSLAGNSPLGALGQLGLARGYARAGDESQSDVAYQQFFTLWKDADPGIPVLRQARAEYQKLR